MNAITTTELAQMRVDAQVALDKACQIQRETNTDDQWGSSSGNYGTISTVMAGVGQPNVSQLTNYAYLVGSLATWLVRLPIGTDVQHQDHLIIDGQTLEVQVVLDPKSYAVLLTLLATEVK